MYMQQIIVDGFFHADPHPGNVFARPGPYLILVDFGMVGRLTPRMRIACELCSLVLSGVTLKQ